MMTLFTSHGNPLLLNHMIPMFCTRDLQRNLEWRCHFFILGVHPSIQEIPEQKHKMMISLLMSPPNDNSNLLYTRPPVEHSEMVTSRPKNQSNLLYAKPLEEHSKRISILNHIIPTMEYSIIESSRGTSLLNCTIPTFHTEEIQSQITNPTSCTRDLQRNMANKKHHFLIMILIFRTQDLQQNIARW